MIEQMADKALQKVESEVSTWFSDAFSDKH
jgi:hypothetical protein